MLHFPKNVGDGDCLCVFLLPFAWQHKKEKFHVVWYIEKGKGIESIIQTEGHHCVRTDGVHSYKKSFS